MGKKFIYRLAVSFNDITEKVVALSDFKFPLNADTDVIKNDDKLYQKVQDNIDALYQPTVEDRNIISRIDVLDCVEYTLTHSRFITDGLYKALHWFNAAIEVYTNPSSSDKDYQDMLKKSQINTWFRCMQPNQSVLKETAYNGLFMKTFTDRASKINNALKVIGTIIKALEISSLEKYQSAYKAFAEELKYSGTDNGHINTLLTVNVQWSRKQYMGYQERLESYAPKEKLFLYANCLVGELRLIMIDLLRPIYKGFGVFNYTNMFDGDISKLLLKTNHRLTIEKKKEELEGIPLDYTLYNIKEKKEELVESADKESILQFLCDSKRSREKAVQLLKMVDEHYLISQTPSFMKRKLAAIVFVMWCSNHVFRPGLSFESFKKNICAYYGHANPSMKPNKIVNEALFEYHQSGWVFKGFNVNPFKIEQYAENK